MNAYEKLQEVLKTRYGIENEDPVEAAVRLLEEFRPEPETPPAQPRVIFAATVLYNHGLGIKTADLTQVMATSFEEADKEAREEADRKFGHGKWIEVKVRPIGPARD
jgi:hypothetical protein